MDDFQYNFTGSKLVGDNGVANEKTVYVDLTDRLITRHNERIIKNRHQNENF